MWKSRIRNLCIILALVMSFSCFSSCGKKDPNSVSADNVDIWGCHASIKVLQSFLDKNGEEYNDATYYDDVKQDAKVSIVMARGEYEGAPFFSPFFSTVRYFS